MPETTPITRFALSGRMTAGRGHHFRLKYNAFLPRPIKGGRPSLSVFRIDGLAEDEVWDLARAHVLPSLSAGRRIHGRGDLTADDVVAVSPLAVDFDDTPRRHANVVDWPQNRAEQKVLAQALAAAATSVSHQGHGS